MADSIQSNPVRQNPDGTMAGVFTGGLELNSASPGGPIRPLAENAVQWLRQADGALVAYLYATERTPGGIVGNNLLQITNLDNDGRGGQLFLSSQVASRFNANQGNDTAAISISNGTGGDDAQVSLEATSSDGTIEGTLTFTKAGLYLKTPGAGVQCYDNYAALTESASGGGAFTSYSGPGGSPAGIYQQLGCSPGLLPGYPNSTYPTLFTNNTYTYIATGNAYTGYIDSAGYHVNSGRTLKRAFKNLNPADILDRIRRLPITEWEREMQPGVRRVGPTAEDWHDTFGYGEYAPDKPENEREPHEHAFIATHDMASIGLAGVQALLGRIEELETRLAHLEGK